MPVRPNAVFAFCTKKTLVKGIATTITIVQTSLICLCAAAGTLAITSLVTEPKSAERTLLGRQWVTVGVPTRLHAPCGRIGV